MDVQLELETLLKKALAFIQGLSDRLCARAEQNTVGSIWIAGSYASKSSRRAPTNALPRRLTWWTNAKNPQSSGKFSCDMP